ncbi:DUF2809 domain-containing protein [Kitasatospora sp. NPDC088134]|uniref:ribosomal maturation YjgA family protein n=1 Tax=Kitasatospora sp. NPDC088134 TaxID=3364071 RepID=UPI00380B2DF1
MRTAETRPPSPTGTPGPAGPTASASLVASERWARAGWLLAAAVVVALGLLLPGPAPAALAALLGGALYTALLHTLLMAAAPRLGPWAAGTTALAASWAVEFFQLSHVPADLAAHSRLACLALGTTFDLPDLLGYLLGATATTATHLALRRLRARH